MAAMIRRSTLRHCSEPTARNSLLLHQAQQLDLHLERQVADLVEEGRAAVGQFDQAPFVLRGAAERALDVAEQFALHERADQRAAVDGDELAARIGVVDGARDHFLAGAALAQQQHRKAVARRLFDETADRSDLRGLAHQPVIPPRGSRKHVSYVGIKSYDEGGIFSPESWRIRSASRFAPSSDVSAPTSTRQTAGFSARWSSRAEP